MGDKPKLNMAVLPGDGIGVEVMNACIPIFSELSLPIQLHTADIGWQCWLREGNAVPDKTWQLIESVDTVLLGATTSKPKREAQAALPQTLRNKIVDYVSPIIQLRKKLDVFANVRHCFNIKGEGKPFDFCIIRENTEGLYAGFDYHPAPPEILALIQTSAYWQAIEAKMLSASIRLQSQQGWLRIFNYAFNYAKQKGYLCVTLADKPNVLRQSSDFTRQLFESVSVKFPEIKASIENVDAVALSLVRRPEKFGVIVAENMFGDILSDVGAGVMGGLGFAPSANIGDEKSYFEPVHGSAPQMGSGRANPSAMFLTMAMLLKHFNFLEAATLIEQATQAVLQAGKTVTYDLGGNATTQEMAVAIRTQCLKMKETSAKPTTPVLKLSQFSTAEISDALDALGIEGVLLGIKPLDPNLTLIGPAFTVQYAPYKELTTAFNQAGNYIDEVPEDVVVVIDNQARSDCTTWGDLLTHYAKQKGIAGTVVNGAVRDVDAIKTQHYPLYCRDVTMRSGKNRVKKVATQCELTIGEVSIAPGDIVMADANGALVIPQTRLPDVLAYAANIQNNEANIRHAVSQGIPLAKARQMFHYDKPWVK